MLNRINVLFLVLVFSSFVMAQEAIDDTIKTEATTQSTVTTKSDTTTTLKSPPPSAITPTINTSNSDLCTFGVAGAVQTQILGISMGSQVTDLNCERLKNAKVMYDMGMKVAAVSIMCQDERVFDAMMNAGTPCPYDGLIGSDAKSAWEVNPEKRPGANGEKNEPDTGKEALLGGAGIGALLLLLLL